MVFSTLRKFSIFLKFAVKFDIMRSSHLSYRTSNPALNKNTFKSISSSNPFTLDQKMTIKGTVDKTAICLILLLIPAYYVFTTGSVGYAIPGAIIGFILAMVTIFKRKWAQYTVPVYSVAQGFFLGGISYYYNQSYEGIVLQSISLTIFILFSLLFAYRSKIIRPDENFKLGLFAATGGIFLLYVVDLIMSIFGSGISFLDVNNSSNFSIGVSLFIVVIASLNLVIDFDFIEEGSEKGAPKFMEWYGAFGLLVTLIWLYLEILRMLAKMKNR